jgi:hypothetical protein
MNGEESVTKRRLRRIFLCSVAIAATTAGVVNTLNVIQRLHDNPGSSVAAPIVAEGSSWITFVLFFWIPWICWLRAPPFVHPRWKLLIHVPGALTFALCHVGGFVLLRKLALWMTGSHYVYGPSVAEFVYELSKDALVYLQFAVGFALIPRLLEPQRLVEAPAQALTFDIRDGAKLTRVRLDEILAIGSVGNYVEFAMRDGRRLLMRSSLSALEGELAPRGFLRTHRSWLVNSGQVTALKPEGSGDYRVELGPLTVPLSRRFPQALARLKRADA